MLLIVSAIAATYALVRQKSVRSDVIIAAITLLIISVGFALLTLKPKEGNSSNGIPDTADIVAEHSLTVLPGTDDYIAHSRDYVKYATSEGTANVLRPLIVTGDPHVAVYREIDFTMFLILPWPTYTTYTELSVP